MRLDPRVIRKAFINSGWTYTAMAKETGKHVSVIHKVLNRKATSRPALYAVRAVLIKEWLDKNLGTS